MVIAHFSKPKAAIFLIFGYSVVALLFFEILHHRSGYLVEQIASKGEFWLPFMVIGGIAGIIFALLLTALLAQMLFDNCNAIWVDDEKIIYLNKFFLTTKRKDIEGVSIGPFGNWSRPAIIIRLYGGAKKTIPLGALSENAKSIIPRLEKWLGKSVDVPQI